MALAASAPRRLLGSCLAALAAAAAGHAAEPWQPPASCGAAEGESVAEVQAPALAVDEEADAALSLLQLRAGALEQTVPKWAAFVLHLDRRPERLASFQKAVREQQPWLLPRLHTISAVDGQKIAADHATQEALVKGERISAASLQEALSETRGAAKWSRLSPGAVGLYLSHAAAWQRIVDSKLDLGVVFEDDVARFTPGFEAAVRQGLLENASLARDDIVYLQHCARRRRAAMDGGSEQASRAPRPALQPLEEHSVVPCTGAYLVSRRAAEQLLARAFPIKKQLDLALAGEVVSGLRRSRFQPAIAQVGHLAATSDVQDRGARNHYGYYGDYGDYGDYGFYGDYGYYGDYGSYGDYGDYGYYGY